MKRHTFRLIRVSGTGSQQGLVARGVVEVGVAQFFQSLNGEAGSATAPAIEDGGAARIVTEGFSYPFGFAVRDIDGAFHMSGLKFIGSAYVYDQRAGLDLSPGGPGGAFVALDETGADGLIPIRDIGREYFHYDRQSQTLMGSDTGLEISVGQRVLVRLREATPETGGLMLELLELDGKSLPKGRARKNKPPTRRKAMKARKKATKVKRKRKG